MDSTIQKAKLLLAEHFKIDVTHFDKNLSRKRAVVEARRFIVYFLRAELDFTYIEIVNAIGSITNHATAIHHYRRMEELLEIEPPIKKYYQKFISKVYGDNNMVVEKEVLSLTNERKEINRKIYKLKKLL